MNEDDYMKNAQGHYVPRDLIKGYERLEDDAVQKILGYAQELHDQINRFKANVHDDLATLMDLLAEQYGITKRGARGKGNMSFMSFDGLKKVQVQIAEHIDFGNELQIAKHIIDELIKEWAATEGTKKEIIALVQHAFQVDKQGRINRANLFALRKIEITDARWKDAMQAINDSIRITGSKSYLRFYKRATTQDAWEAVTIDIAK